MQHRARRAPSFVYDNLIAGNDSLEFVDRASPQLINHDRIAIDQSTVSGTVPDQMKLTALVTCTQVNAKLAIRQRATLRRHDQIHLADVDINHHLGRVGLFQLLFSRLKANMIRATDVKMDLPQLDGGASLLVLYQPSMVKVFMGSAPEMNAPTLTLGRGVRRVNA